MAKMSRELETRVRQVLNDQWNPIGLDCPPDEYDSYGRVICSMIANSRECTSHNFAEYLIKVVQESMGLQPNMDRVRRTAAGLTAVRDEIQSA
jgi:hypothetical protein